MLSKRLAMQCGELLDKLDSAFFSDQDRAAATLAVLREILRSPNPGPGEQQVVAAAFAYCETIVVQGESANDLFQQFLGEVLTTLIETRDPQDLQLILERHGVPIASGG